VAQLSYREHAAQAHADAESATLDMVRDRCLRAEAAWVAMAERQERVDKLRAEREGVPAGPALLQDNE
jgi:hypothetical protein